MNTIIGAALACLFGAALLLAIVFVATIGV
jgi:hypothetical protein